MNEFFGAWGRGVVFVLIGIGGVCVFFGGCTAMIVIPLAAAILPMEFVEPKWLGVTIGVVCMLVVFGGIFALLDDT